MELFHLIDDGVAIIRVGGTLYKQVKLYHRGDRVFIGHAGGYARITGGFGAEYGTSAPNVKVLDLEGNGVVLDGYKEPRFDKDMPRFLRK